MAVEITLLDRIGIEDRLQSMIEEVDAGLRGSPKRISPKYFYDRRGSELFEEITRLDEYYQTRTERSILGSIVDTLAERFPFTDLVEFGSGNSEKTRLLLETLSGRGSLRTYHPIDVSREFLVEIATNLADDYPKLDVNPVLGDFVDGLAGIRNSGPTLVAFLGGTIGNLYAEEAQAFLSTIRKGMTPGDGLLLGYDLVKEPSTLHAAYNDRHGVTAAFNKNVLHVLNRELDGDFNPDGFAHYAFYSPGLQQIEMHLVSRFRQSVHINLLDCNLIFEEGESILTEISRKFTRNSVTRMLVDGGFILREWWTDPDELFALALAIPNEGGGG